VAQICVTILSLFCGEIVPRPSATWAHHASPWVTLLDGGSRPSALSEILFSHSSARSARSRRASMSLSN
jgi:hypothetical protein